MLDDLFKGKVVTGLAIGLGASILAPKVLPVLAEALKPLAKGAMKGGILVYEKGKETLAEVAEVTEDMWAEARAELEEEQADAAGIEQETEVQPGAKTS